MDNKELEEQSLEIERLKTIYLKKKEETYQRLEFQKAKKEIEDQIKDLDIKSGVIQQPPKVTPSEEQLELEKLRKEVAILKSTTPILESRFTTATPEWNGEIDYNHPGLEYFAKSVHKKYKEIELSSSFNYSTPFSKNNELGEAKLLWTNLTSIIKCLEVKGINNEEDLDILGIILNMCSILAQKRDLAIVRSTTDEETARLFKSMKGANNLLSEKNKEFISQALSMREAQIRIRAPTNAPRHRDYDNSHQNQYSQNRGNYRGRSGFNGNARAWRGRGNQFNNAVQQYSQAPQKDSGAGSDQ